MQGAYGGVLNEAVILASIIFSIIRFGWKGLDELDGHKELDAQNDHKELNAQDSHEKTNRKAIVITERSQICQA